MNRWWVLMLTLAAALPVAAADASNVVTTRSLEAAAAAGPAEWRTWDLLVDFRDLPQPYSCNELWYRMRDLLLAIGARPGVQILAYHCGPTRALSSRSPSVQLEFQLPSALPAADARYANVSVAHATVHLEPGTLQSFTPEDCELLKQVSNRLLPALPVHVIGARLTCPAPGAAHHSFALEVQALIPRTQATRASRPRSPAGAAP